MWKRARTIAVAAAISTCLLLASAFVWAHTVWLEGRVGKAPWTEKYRHIEVNGVKYTFMPDATINVHHRNGSGSYVDDPIPLSHIRKGQRVLIRIQGYRIYEITVLE
jgi:hypothetical protein